MVARSPVPISVLTWLIYSRLAVRAFIAEIKQCSVRDGKLPPKKGATSYGEVKSNEVGGVAHSHERIDFAAPKTTS